MLDHVIYPPEFDPRISAIYALNEIDVKAPAAVVWKLLVEAETWSNYFPPENQVKLPAGQTELSLGTRYSRVTIGSLMHPVSGCCSSSEFVGVSHRAAVNPRKVADTFPRCAAVYGKLGPIDSSGSG